MISLTSKSPLHTQSICSLLHDKIKRKKEKVDHYLRHWCLTSGLPVLFIFTWKKSSTNVKKPDLATQTEEASNVEEKMRLRLIICVSCRVIIILIITMLWLFTKPKYEKRNIIIAI